MCSLGELLEIITGLKALCSRSFRRRPQKYNMHVSAPQERMIENDLPRFSSNDTDIKRCF